MYVTPQAVTQGSIAQEASSQIKALTGVLVPAGVILEHFKAEGTGSRALGGNGSGGYNLAGIMSNGGLATYQTPQSFLAEYVGTAATDIRGAQQKGLVGSSGVLTPQGYALALQQGGSEPYCGSACGGFYTTGSAGGGTSAASSASSDSSSSANASTGSPLADTLILASQNKPGLFSFITSPGKAVSYTMTELFGALIGIVFIGAGVWALVSNASPAKAIRRAIGLGGK